MLGVFEVVYVVSAGVYESFGFRGFGSVEALYDLRFLYCQVVAGDIYIYNKYIYIYIHTYIHTRI